MITLDDFYRAYGKVVAPPDREQRAAVERPATDAVFIVAGPGTGKTTSLTLRILKLILVDDVPPRGVLATTFTVKAAAELRSRILGRGFRLIETLRKDRALAASIRERVARIDINQVRTGTIDSICEQLLREFRDPGTQPPVLADDFVAKTLLLREGLLASRRYEDKDLDGFLLDLHGGSRWGFHVGRMNDLVQSIWDRRFHDQLDWPAFVKGARREERTARRVLGEVVDAYAAALAERGMVDFALLEQEVLQRLRAGRLEEFRRDLRVVLVDEYQDTNLLQEALYFELAKACRGALTVVGDDDQSLYRFRGATVELFSEFARRYQQVFRRRPAVVFLTGNYRSTRRIVELVNGYARLDDEYRTVRVGAKPALKSREGAPDGVPILGMFRKDRPTLAKDLATFVHRVFRGRGYRLLDGTVIERASEGGDLGDCALLCSSPAEYNRNDDPRLPRLLRAALAECSPSVAVFNPRGQDLTEIPIIERFGGLLLECLDPGGALQAQTRGLAPDMMATFDRWRQDAVRFAQSRTSPARLKDYAVGWADRSPGRAGWQWPFSVPVLELLYGLAHFFPEIHDDPEGQIYLEVFTRQVSACGLIGKFKGRVVTDPSNQELSDRSVMELLRDFLGPIAGGTIKVNEELMEAFPRDRLSILSIHQAKGLEFPLTIVDVGSDYKGNYPAQAFKRFPTRGGTPHAMEDLLRPYCDLGAPRRSETDRAFDDLFRQYFVAYSRPQEVLLLVGLEPTFPGGPVRNVATGWARNGICRWASNRPFVGI